MSVDDIPMTELEEEQLSLMDQMRRLRRRLNGVQLLFDSAIPSIYARMEKQVDQLGQVADLVKRVAEHLNETRDDVENKHQRVLDVLGRLVKEE